MGNLTKYEQETTINYNQEEKFAECFTHDRTLIRKLDELSRVNTEITVLERTEDYARYCFPKKWVKVKPPRQLSDEKRKELAERARRNFGGK